MMFRPRFILAGYLIVVLLLIGLSGATVFAQGVDSDQEATGLVEPVTTENSNPLRKLLNPTTMLTSESNSFQDDETVDEEESGFKFNIWWAIWGGAAWLAITIVLFLINPALGAAWVEITFRILLFWLLSRGSSSSSSSRGGRGGGGSGRGN